MKKRDMAEERKALLELARDLERRDSHARRKADALLVKLAKRVAASSTDSKLVRSCVCGGDDWIYYVNEKGRLGFYTRNEENWIFVGRRSELYWDGVVEIVGWFEKFLVREKIWARTSDKRRKKSDA